VQNRLEIRRNSSEYAVLGVSIARRSAFFRKPNVSRLQGRAADVLLDLIARRKYLRASCRFTISVREEHFECNGDCMRKHATFAERISNSPKLLKTEA